jgi:uncharacterized protein YmfQ (DUF2313 family)
MAKPVFTDADYAQALSNLLPPGKAWNRDPDSVQAQAVSCYAPTFRRNSDDALALLIDAFPATAVNLLPEWEATLGLPDPCAGVSPTLQGRRAQVVARFSAYGGQSASDFQTYAAGLGYSVTVKQFAPFRMGQSVCGSALGGLDWFYTWAIEAQGNPVTPFSMGRSTVGEPLASWGNAVLECELRAIAPAHSILQFHYS